MQYILSANEYNELVNKVAMQERTLLQLNEVKRDLAGALYTYSAELQEAKKAYASLQQELIATNAAYERLVEYHEADVAALRIPLHILKHIACVVSNDKAVDAINTMCRLLDVHPLPIKGDHCGSSKTDYDAIAALKAKLNEFGEIER